jgi:hypothetical protein
MLTSSRFASSVLHGYAADNPPVHFGNQHFLSLDDVGILPKRRKHRRIAEGRIHTPPPTSSPGMTEEFDTHAIPGASALDAGRT